MADINNNNYNFKLPNITNISTGENNEKKTYFNNKLTLHIYN